MDPVTIVLGGFFSDLDMFLSGAANPPLRYQVPANKRLTIESVTASASVPTGQSTYLRLMVMKPNVGVPLFNLDLTLAYQVTYAPDPNDQTTVLNLWSMSQCLRAYIDPGLIVQLDGFRGLSYRGRGGAGATITGFLDDA